MNMENIGNHYEILVARELDRLIEEGDAQFSQAELEDIACLALNGLSPHYIRSQVDLLSHISDKDQEATQVKVRKAVKKAVNHRERRQSSRED